MSVWSAGDYTEGLESDIHRLKQENELQRRAMWLMATDLNYYRHETGDAWDPPTGTYRDPDQVKKICQNYLERAK